MQLIVPMSGQGSRFVAAGYTNPKPLIKVEGKPIIAHVLDMFPGIDDVVFICNKEHLRDTEMEAVLRSLKPNSTIIPIDSHKKGPVYAITYAYEYLNEEEDVMISYCDFTQRWDFEKFKQEVATRKVAGAVPAYTGFHPHLLHKGLYGGILADGNQMLIDYKEKHCFTEDPQDSYHSSGSYYFSSGALIKKYFTELLETGETINGEAYVSMVYYLLMRDQLPIYVPTADHFMQWGTPEDLEEYEAWSRKIHQEENKDKQKTDIPSEREPFVNIPHSEDSSEYARSDSYWRAYIKTL